MRQNEAKCGRELLPRMAFRSLRDTDCRSSVGKSHRVGGSSPPGSLDLKFRRDADMLMVKIMIYLAVVAAALIVVCTLAGGGHDGH